MTGTEILILIAILAVFGGVVFFNKGKKGKLSSRPKEGGDKKLR